MRRLVLAVLALVFSSCATYRSLGYAPVSREGGGQGPEIVQIKLKFTNGYLIKSKRPILIDPGAPWDFGRLSYALKENGVKPEELALVILTHGHADHAGLGAMLQKTYHVKVAAGAADFPMLAEGKNDELKSQYFSASLIKPIVDVRFDPFTPDIAIKEPLDLKAYGIDAKVIPLPGHTPGSLVVMLPDHRAFVGDVMLGGSLGGILWPESPGEHYYQADAAANFRNIRWLEKQGIETFYLGHGGPVKRADVFEAFKGRIPSSETADAAFAAGAYPVPPPPVFFKDPDLFMAFRANAPHFWYWARTALPQALKLPGYQPLYRQGIVVGDAHILNFADIYPTGRPPIVSCDDLDDTGTGPMLGDVVRFYASALLSKNLATRTELVSAYVRGLSGLRPITEPDFVQKVESLTDADVRAARAKFVAKNSMATATNPPVVTFNFAKTKLTPIEQLTNPATKSLYDRMTPAMSQALQGFRVLSAGFKTKNDGGSHCMARFWFLAQSPGADGELRIFEFKQLGDSSVAQLEPQPPTSTRLSGARQVFWGDSPDPRAQDFQYKFVTNGTDSFWMRPKYTNLIDADGAPADFTKALMIFEANVLGRIHAVAGAKDYAALFQYRQPEVEKVLEQLTQSYIAALTLANAGAAAGAQLNPCIP